MVTSTQPIFIDTNVLVYANDLDEGHRHLRSTFSPYWYALIIEAALRCGAERLVSEQLRHGRRSAQLVVKNPFR
ncbi:hypothetical protein [Longimycelium tulufanense]|uniref:hypothetical protein n=1 Tax=Longimycelium tulufanense TaxID=907463 RepID=UPI001E49C84A|nr:hypothetical protein [Longimycelium tulufanense]